MKIAHFDIPHFSVYQFLVSCTHKDPQARNEWTPVLEKLTALIRTLSVSTDSLGNQRYQLGALLGEGGFGAVYRAHDTQLKNDVAQIAHGVW